MEGVFRYEKWPDKPPQTPDPIFPKFADKSLIAHDLEKLELENRGHSNWSLEALAVPQPVLVKNAMAVTWKQSCFGSKRVGVSVFNEKLLKHYFQDLRFTSNLKCDFTQSRKL